jgi:hypothetical protein
VERNLTTGLLTDSMNETSDVMDIITENDPNFERSTEVNRGIHDMISFYKEMFSPRGKASDKAVNS